MTLKFSKEFDDPLNESKVRSLKSYITAQDAKKRKTGVVLESLPPKKHGCPLLLSDNLDTQVQAYIRASQARGCVVKSSLAIAGTMGILKKTIPALLENNFELLSKSWMKSILFRMGYVKHRGTTTAKINPCNF